MNDSVPITSVIPPWLVALLAFLAIFAVLILTKRLLLAVARRLVDKTTLTLDSLLVESLDTPLTIILLLVSYLMLGRLLAHLDIDIGFVDGASVSTYHVLLTLALIVFVDRLASNALARYAPRSDVLRSSMNILKGLTRVVVIGVGALVILGTMGISVTPVIASLGITSLAVALALQPTLENFFSGIQLVVDKPIRVGDYIELDSGEQGFVEKIGWRSTWIRMLPNNIIIMPNSSLSKTKIINYYYPEKELSVPVEVGVHYSSDLEHVERVTLEVAREVLVRHKWGVDDYATFVVFHTFDESSINFTVMLRAKEYFNRFFIKSDFIKALHKRYAEEGIVIPFPIRAINTTQEGRGSPDGRAGAQ